MQTSRSAILIILDTSQGSCGSQSVKLRLSTTTVKRGEIFTRILAFTFPINLRVTQDKFRTHYLTCRHVSLRETMVPVLRGFIGFLLVRRAERKYLPGHLKIFLRSTITLLGL